MNTISYDLTYTTAARVLDYATRRPLSEFWRIIEDIQLVDRSGDISKRLSILSAQAEDLSSLLILVCSTMEGVLCARGLEYENRGHSCVRIYIATVLQAPLNELPEVLKNLPSFFGEVIDLSGDVPLVQAAIANLYSEAVNLVNALREGMFEQTRAELEAGEVALFKKDPESDAYQLSVEIYNSLKDIQGLRKQFSQHVS